jgi:hypothetical protein
VTSVIQADSNAFREWPGLRGVLGSGCHLRQGRESSDPALDLLSGLAEGYFKIQLLLATIHGYLYGVARAMLIHDLC